LPRRAFARTNSAVVQSRKTVHATPFVRLTLLVAAAATISCTRPSPNTGSSPAPIRAGDAIHILHFNDVYEITPVEAGRSGGLARVAGLRRALRDSFPSLITTLGGDYISPSALGTARVGGERLNGRQMVSVLNAVGLDIAVLGNHEFDVSRDAFLARMNESQFVLLAANVSDSERFGQCGPSIREDRPARDQDCARRRPRRAHRVLRRGDSSESPAVVACW
jgi:2',3'-cyclic-nucleotide 2'-phosphodiesterase (5'-nucleotidase family)